VRKTEQLKAEFLCISSVLHYEQPVVRSLKSADSVMKRLPDMQTNTILYLFAVFFTLCQRIIPVLLKSHHK